MEFEIGPEPKRKPYPTFSLIILIVAILGLGWWQREKLPLPVDQSSEPDEAALATATSAQPSSSRVELVYSTVVDTESEAFTADLYLQEAEHADEAEWGGLGGRTEVQTYTVQSGDTLWGIAARFELDLDTLRWSNPDLERNPDLLTPGAALLILPVIGAYHTVAEGDTVQTIAEHYGVADVDIINYPLNKLEEPFTLKVGQNLVIPNGRKDVVIPPPAQDPDYRLAWPLVGRITQGYHADHLALDLGSTYGAEVYAADGGTVIHAQWARTGYGFTVIIDHGDNFHTLYSHLKGTLVQSGQQVSRGEPIGAVGSTGNSTGPHVHFEVRVNGERVSPLDYLKPR